MPVCASKRNVDAFVANVKRLVAPANGGSTFNERTECFTVNVDSAQPGKTKTLRLKGLVPALHECFYPDFQMSRPAQGGTEKAPIVGSSAKLKKGTKRAGMARGKAVDEAIIRAVKTRNFTPSCRATRHIFAALFKMGLTPAMTQVSVHGMSKDVRIGTAADLVCVNEAMQPVIVEIKTGYSNQWDAHNGKMKAPLNTLTNSPKNQHMLQVALTAELFYYTTGIKVADAFVLRVIASGVDYTRVTPEIRKHVGTIVKVLQKKYHE